MDYFVKILLLPRNFRNDFVFVLLTLTKTNELKLIKLLNKSIAMGNRPCRPLTTQSRFQRLITSTRM